MPVEFEVPAEGPDIYRNFVIPVEIPEDKWVSAIELRPAARTVLHHALFFADSTGSARRADAADPLPGFSGLLPVASNLNVDDAIGIVTGAGPVASLGGWVPGTFAEYLPEGLAIPLRKGADFILQAHFHPNGESQREKAVIGIYFASKTPAKTLSTILVPTLFGYLSGIDIPAGENRYMLRDSFVLPIEIEAVNVSAHAHYLARDMKLTATLPTGEVRVLLWISDWDLEWQDFYFFKELVRLPAGTRLDAEILYDNSANNDHNPSNPPVRVQWGEQSTDEMGSLILTVVPAQQSDLPILQAALVQQLAQTMARRLERDPARPALISSGVVGGADGRFGPLVPGKIVVLYGKNLGPEQLKGGELVSDGRVSTTLGGSRVLINDTPAPLIYSSAEQVSAIVPYAIEGRQGAQLQIDYGGRRSEVVAFPATGTGPSIFTADFSGRGQAIALNQDGLTVNSARTPAEQGSIITLYATGEGQTDPPGVDGKLATMPLAKPRLPVTAHVAGLQAEVTYAGAAPGLVAGVMQLNLKLPSGIPSGPAEVKIFIGGVQSQGGVTIAAK
jgi:uncharacterized protein (TIGR03437 family)